MEFRKRDLFPFDHMEKTLKEKQRAVSLKGLMFFTRRHGGAEVLQGAETRRELI